ncbi:MAG: hypothetical protein HN790_04210 [Methylococcales bacterium]|jgi:hypothetical protein|nr:hypothetical protein [Methylococcales bacterium]
MKVKSKEKLISKGGIFVKLEQLDSEVGSNGDIVGLMMGVVLVSIMTLSMLLVH